MITKKEVKKQKRKDIQFIISAVTTELHDMAYYEYFNTWENSGGMQWFFDECVDITKKIMLSEGSAYLQWLEYFKTTNDTYPLSFCDLFGEPLDWYHMDKAKAEFQTRYDKDVYNLPIEKREVDLIIKLLKDIDVDGETMEHILNKVGMEEQMFRQLIKKAEKYID